MVCHMCGYIHRSRPSKLGFENTYLDLTRACNQANTHVRVPTRKNRGGYAPCKYFLTLGLIRQRAGIDWDRSTRSQACTCPQVRRIPIKITMSLFYYYLGVGSGVSVKPPSLNISINRI
jgi:hypothetical protein